MKNGGVKISEMWEDNVRWDEKRWDGLRWKGWDEMRWNQIWFCGRWNAALTLTATGGGGRGPRPLPTIRIATLSLWNLVTFQDLIWGVRLCLENVIIEFYGEACWRQQLRTKRAPSPLPPPPPVVFSTKFMPWPLVLMLFSRKKTFDICPPRVLIRDWGNSDVWDPR